MKLSASKNQALAAVRQAGRTLTETMVASALMVLVTITIVICNIAGLKFAEFVQPKVQNSQYARQTVARIIEEVRCANSVQVGTGTDTGFTPVGSSRPQAGNAIRIFPSTNMSQYIYYYLDTNNASVVEMPLGSSNGTAIATFVTNNTPFSFENYSGATLTNPANNAVLSVQLQMRRNSAVAGVGDSYQVRSRITRRNIL